MIKEEHFKKIAFIKHGFFTKKNGVSSGIYKSLNCGYGSNDSAENIQKNRNIILKQLIEAKYLCNLHQLHSNKVFYVDKPWQYPNLPKYDAMVTDKKNIAIAILTADCVPILFCDTKAQIIAATHAGWKGTANGIIQNTIAKMIEIGAEKENIITAIGPAIQQKSYEVADDFRVNFEARVKNSDVFFINSVKENHFLFDLPACVENILVNCGIVNIHNLKIDTYSNEDDFFSYRRATHKNESDYGRQMSAIVLK